MIFPPSMPPAARARRALALGILDEASTMALTLDQVKVAAKGRLAATRFSRETGGITVNGTSILTDRDTQDALDRIFSCYDRQLISGAIDFRMPGGWASMTEPQLRAIAGLIAQHVQACWSAQRVAEEAVDAATTVEAVEAIVAGFMQT